MLDRFNRKFVFALADLEVSSRVASEDDVQHADLLGEIVSRSELDYEDLELHPYAFGWIREQADRAIVAFDSRRTAVNEAGRELSDRLSKWAANEGLQLVELAEADPDAASGGIWWLLRRPASLAGMAYPDSSTDWAALARQGFSTVLQLEPGDYDPAPLARLDPVLLEDLADGGPPGDPDAEEQLVYVAAETVTEHISREKGVVVHCLGGRGRTGTVLACALRRLGFTFDEAVGAVEERGGAFESVWQRDVVRRCGKEAGGAV